MTCNTQFAITYTVKNEAWLLPAAIEYHLAAGCSQIYVFLDGTTDNTAELITGYDNVRILTTTKPTSSENLPSWISRLLPWWETDMDVRKRINTYYATILANHAGIEWITNIDPDELIIPAAEGDLNKRLIPDFLGQIPERYDQILMRNLEVIPTAAESENPFADCKVFLNRFPATEFMWRYSSAAVRRAIRNPRLHAWFDHWFYKIRFWNALPRLMVHPVTGQSIPAGYFLGYSNHKSFIRTNCYPEYTFVIHKWIRNKSRPTNIYQGFVLHYDLFDYKYMALKFRQRSEHMLLPVFYFRYMLASVARDSSITQVKEFFEKYIAIVDAKRTDLLVKRGIALHIDFVADFFTDTRSSTDDTD